jgi:MerR family transcriptional regulator, light-induced transcriptional regulator
VLPTLAEVDLLSRIAVQPDLDKAIELALGMLSAGLSLETVLLHLIGPAARRLGTDWEEDLRSFADVTVGLGTLHELVHLLARREAGEAIETSATGHAVPRRRALLVGSPGEQHTLGLYIFAELLRHSRWAVAVEATLTDSTLLQVVRSQSLDMVGIAVSASERFVAVAQLIQRIRRVSLNTALRVVVGGPVNLASEAQAHDVLYFSDARRAVDWLDGE